MPDSEPYKDCRMCPYVFSKFKYLRGRCPFNRSELVEFRRRTEGKVHAIAVEIWRLRTKPLENIHSSAVGKPGHTHRAHNHDIFGSNPTGAFPAGLTDGLQDTGIGSFVVLSLSNRNYCSSPCDHHEAAICLIDFFAPILSRIIFWLPPIPLTMIYEVGSFILRCGPHIQSIMVLHLRSEMLDSSLHNAGSSPSLKGNGIKLETFYYFLAGSNIIYS